jgi:hypothetical protein
MYGTVRLLPEFLPRLSAAATQCRPGQAPRPGGPSPGPGPGTTRLRMAPRDPPPPPRGGGGMPRGPVRSGGCRTLPIERPTVTWQRSSVGAAGSGSLRKKTAGDLTQRTALSGAMRGFARQKQCPPRADPPATRSAAMRRGATRRNTHAKPSARRNARRLGHSGLSFVQAVKRVMIDPRPRRRESLASNRTRSKLHRQVQASIWYLIESTSASDD